MALSPEEWLAQQEATQDSELSPEMWLQNQFQTMTPLEKAKFQSESGVFRERTFDPRVPTLSTGIGATIGATPLGRVGSMAGGVVKGAAGGFLGGAAGEAVRTYDEGPYAQVIAFALEAAGGAAPSMVGEVIGRASPAALGATMGYQKGKALQTITGRSESDTAVRNTLFTRQAVQEGVASQAARNRLNVELAEGVAGRYNIIVPDGQKTTDVVRSTIKESIDNQAAMGSYMKDSIPFRNAMQELKSLVNDKVISKEQYNAAVGLLNRQSTSSKTISGKFSDDLINSIQKAEPEFGGVKLDKETTALILKRASDEYLDSLGVPTISALKGMENAGFTALAVDSIPVVLNQTFKGEALEQALTNIHKSPEGQKQFRVALATYFRELPAKDVLQEWNRLAPGIRSYKTLPPQEIAKMERAVTELAKRSKGGQVAKDIGANSLRMGIVRGFLPAEMASFALEGEKPPELGVFTL